MKPILIAVTSAMLSAPAIISVRPPAPPPPRPQPSIRSTDLDRLVWLAKADAASALGGTEFAFAHPPRHIAVTADSAALRGGLSRLMVASAATMRGRPRRTLAWRLTLVNGRPRLEMSDSGPGLEVPDLAEMYAGSSAFANARRRIERGGGVVNVSTQSGVGSVFVIDFPGPG